MTPVLDIQHLTKSIGDVVLFSDISFSVAEGGHVGLIARNGAGKTTLLNILSGKDDFDSGEVVFRSGIRVGYLDQAPAYEPTMTVLDACFQGAGELSDLTSRYEHALLSPGTPELESLIEEMDRRGAWDFELRARQILSKLDITELTKPVSQLSGGQLKRVALAGVLLAEPDLLILDEPTNHLDISMIEWLETYLRRSTKSLLMVTHDRYFLESVCSVILELDDQSLYTYRGNYAYYLEKRDTRLEAARAEHARAQNLYRRELEWIRRMPQARGGKARYRKEAFAELEQQVARRIENRMTRLEVKSGYIGSKIFEAQYVSKQFQREDGSSITILRDFYYNFARFEKLGIIGANGTGKSTFIKMLLGEVKPDAGRFDVGETVRFGYFSQDGIVLDEQKRVIDVLREVAETIDLGGGRRLTATQFLTHFLFPPQRQQDYVYKLSGGERRRLQLCVTLMQSPNFLILDEPTNDLDIPTLSVLEAYLADFKGCVIIVSHDRYFMDQIVDHLLVFRGDGKVEDFPGGYTQFREWEAARDKAEEEAQTASKGRGTTAQTGAASKANTWGGEKRRRLTFRERQELASLEAEIEALEAEKMELEAALCSGTLTVDELTEKSRRLPALEATLDEKSTRWLELSEIEG